jgi:hypothetical protein
MVECWIVDEFCDAIKPRMKKALTKENEFRASWKRPPLITFESEQLAVEWMIQRAEARVEKAEQDLRNKKRRLQNCLKKRSA